MCQNTKYKDQAYVRMADSQKHWQRRTLILMAILTEKPLDEATLSEWQEDYDWVRLNLIQRGANGNHNWDYMDRCNMESVQGMQEG